MRKKLKTNIFYHNIIQCIPKNKQTPKWRLDSPPQDAISTGINVLDLETRWTYVTAAAGHRASTEIFLEFLRAPTDYTYTYKNTGYVGICEVKVLSVLPVLEGKRNMMVERLNNNIHLTDKVILTPSSGRSTILNFFKASMIDFQICLC